jgi:uncharacterized BrkB/YihY/UPF0761 family membrane protein
MNVPDYYCPVTGQNLQAKQCRRRGFKLISPYADVPVQTSGWRIGYLGFFLFALAYVFLKSAPVACSWLFLAGIAALMLFRLARQYLIFRKWRSTSPSRPNGLSA